MKNGRNEDVEIFNNYQKKAITTKIYDDSVAIPYIVLGIVGEAGELFEKIIQDEDQMGSPIELLTKEIGDVAWYLAGFCAETSQKLGDVSMLKTCVQKTKMGLDDLKTNLVTFSAEIAEVVKKALRDDLDFINENHTLPAVKLNKATVSVANLLENIDALCYYYDVELYDIMQANIEKLASRAKRDVLKGSGDER